MTGTSSKIQLARGRQTTMTGDDAVAVDEDGLCPLNSTMEASGDLRLGMRAGLRAKGISVSILRYSGRSCSAHWNKNPPQGRVIRVVTRFRW